MEVAVSTAEAVEGKREAVVVTEVAEGKMEAVVSPAEAVKGEDGGDSGL